MRWLALLSLATIGCTAADPLVGRTTGAVFGGGVDETDVAIVSFLDGPIDAPYELCSAVVVGPRVVLTAAHCVKSGRTHHIQLGTKTKLPTRSIDVTAVHVYPRYSGPGEDQRAGLDLAVAITAEDIGVTPVALANEPDDLSVGAALTLIGFGQSSKTEGPSIGERHAVIAEVTGVCDRLFAIGDESRGFCGGDSGGAVLRTSDAGPATLVGLIGFGVKPGCAPPGYAVRIAPYARWIASFVSGAGDTTCATTCPPAGFCGATQRDAGSDADAAVPTPTPPPPDSGGCAIGARASTLETTTFALLLSGVVIRSARRRRDTSSRSRRDVALRPRAFEP